MKSRVEQRLRAADAEERLLRATAGCDYFEEQVDAIMRTDSTWTFCALVVEAEALLPAVPLVALLVLDVPEGVPVLLLDCSRPRISTSWLAC